MMNNATPLTLTPDLLSDPGKRVKSVIALGTAPPVSASVPLNRYYRSLTEMHRMAGIHLVEKDLERALVLYVRFISMLLERLPEHPNFKAYSSPEQIKVQEKLHGAIASAESLKLQLKQRYEQESVVFNAKEAQRQAEKAELDQKLAEERELIEQKRFSDSLVSPSAPPLHVSAPNIDTYSINFPSLEPTSSAAPPSYEQSWQPQPPEYSSRPVIDRSTKPRIVHDLGDDYSTLSTNGLKLVIVAASLVDGFLAKAMPNTMRGVETCAILCGKMALNRFTITHAVIPKQNGGPDSCDTEHEEQVFEFQDAHDMITIGWIHTHPTQTAFLSSVDLHTHCSYQLMMPEAIAIVCSPKFDETGVFRLSADGLDQISHCRQSGFHPHQQSPALFENCAHAVLSTAVEGFVVDLRS